MTLHATAHHLTQNYTNAKGMLVDKLGNGDNAIHGTAVMAKF